MFERGGGGGFINGEELTEKIDARRPIDTVRLAVVAR